MTLCAFLLASTGGDSTQDLLRPILGAPLLVRQLEWLSSQGVTRATINRVAADPLPSELREEELSSSGCLVSWIPSVLPLSVPELASRVGLRDGIAVVVPHARLGDIDLRASVALATDSGQDVVVRCHGRSIVLRHLDRPCRRKRVVDADGWLLDAIEERTAHELEEQVLLGQKRGIVVRGREVASGIWLARGAVASQTATLRPPCYLGRNSFISEETRIGPGAVIGEYAIVEPGVRIVHARVAPNVVVGQGLSIEHGCVVPGHIIRHAGRDVAIDDPLLLDFQMRSAHPIPRLAAAIMLGAVAPVAAIRGGRAAVLMRRLARIVDGSGRWLGIRVPADPDAVAVDIVNRLVPQDAREEEHAAARAWYARTKNPRKDLRMLADWLAQAVWARNDTGEG